MTREIKANILFLVVLILLMAPGFVFLIHRRLNGPSKPMFMGEPVPSMAAYNQPPPVPPNLPRVEPEVVRAWVMKELQADAGQSARMLRTSDDPAAGPVMGDRYITQGVSLESRGDGTLIRLMAWDAQPLTPATARIVGFADSKTIAGGATQVRSIDVPVDVRHALQDKGFIDPPKKVAWIVCEFAAPVDRLRIELPSRKPETLTLPATGATP